MLPTLVLRVPPFLTLVFRRDTKGLKVTKVPLAHKVQLAHKGLREPLALREIRVRKETKVLKVFKEHRVTRAINQALRLVQLLPLHIQPEHQLQTQAHKVLLYLISAFHKVHRGLRAIRETKEIRATRVIKVLLVLKERKVTRVQPEPREAKAHRVLLGRRVLKETKDSRGLKATKDINLVLRLAQQQPLHTQAVLL